MIVYMDTALLLAFFINGMLLWLPGRLINIKTSAWRLMAGTAAGVLYGVFCFFADYYQVWLSLCAAYVQVCVAYPKKKSMLYFGYLLSACVLAGWQQMFSFYGVLALLLFILGVYILLFLGRKLYAYIRTEKLYRKIKIGMDGKCLEFTGYIDSGNRLSVAVIDAQTAIKLMGEKRVLDMQKMQDSENFRYSLMPCTTVSGEGFIPVFKPDYMTIDGKKSNMQVGINFMPMQETMLLPKKILEVL